MHDIEFALNAKRTRKLKRKWTGHGHGQANNCQLAKWRANEHGKSKKKDLLSGLDDVICMKCN